MKTNTPHTKKHTNKNLILSICLVFFAIFCSFFVSAQDLYYIDYNNLFLTGGSITGNGADGDTPRDSSPFTVTAGTGTLYAVEINIWAGTGGGTGQVRYNIYNDSGRTQLLAYTDWISIPDNDQTNTNTLNLTFNSGDGVNVVPGSTYYTEFQSSGFSGAGVDNWVYRYMNSIGTNTSYQVWAVNSTPAPTLTAKLVNASRNDTGTTIEQFGDLFHVFANMSNNDGTLQFEDCSYYTPQINHQYENEQGNVSLTNLNNVTLLSSDDESNITLDIILFRACRDQVLGVDLQVYINDFTTANYTVPASVIPPCSAGTFHEEIYLTTDFINSQDLNVSVKCSSCTAGKTMRILKQERNVNLVVIREHDNYSDDLTYNASSGYYEDTELHSFATSGDKTINVTCNQSNYDLNISVIGQVPVPNYWAIFVDGVFNNYVNGSVIEAGANVSILGECSGAIIDKIELNISYTNGTFIANETVINDNDVNLTISNSLLGVTGQYNTSLECTAGNRTELLYQYFNYQDTQVTPGITWFNPLVSNTTETAQNNTMQLRVDFEDVNLFGYNCTVTDPNSVLQYQYSQTGLTVPYFSLQQSIIPTTAGIWQMYCRVTDDHTAEEIPSYLYSVEDDDIYFMFKKIKDKKITAEHNLSIEYFSGGKVDKVTLQKKKDRYTFNYKFKKGTLDDYVESMHRFKISCKDIMYRETSDYIAHFVCPHSENWIDFENEHIRTYNIRCTENSCEIDLYTNPVEDFTFRSIGGLNQFNQTVLFNVTEVSNVLSIDLFDCPDTLQGQFMLFSLMFFLFIIFVVGLIFAPILSFFASIGVMFMSTIYYTCQTFGGIALAMCSLLMIVVSIARGFFMKNG